jgi:hypothetical protein
MLQSQNRVVAGPPKAGPVMAAYVGSLGHGSRPFLQTNLISG